MADYADLLNLFKKTAVGAVNAGDPVSVEFGKVVSVSPLKVQIDQKLILEASQLVLTRSVQNHSVTVNAVSAPTSIGSVTGTASVGGEEGTASIPAHSGTTAVPANTGTVVANLAAGDVVIMVKMQGGGKYVILDKVVS